MYMTPQTARQVSTHYMRIRRRGKTPQRTRSDMLLHRLHMVMPSARFEATARAMFRLFTRTHKAGG